jgi:hypothetical protein
LIVLDPGGVDSTDLEYKQGAHWMWKIVGEKSRRRIRTQHCDTELCCDQKLLTAMLGDSFPYGGFAV